MIYVINVNVSSDAEIDLLNGSEYYESKKNGLGFVFRSSILADLTSLELLGGTHAMKFNLHRKLCKTYPYWIYYRMDSDTSLTVVAIVGQRRGEDYLNARLGVG